jgi:hypothetical protein
MIYRSIHAGFGETGSSTVMKFKDALKISLEMEKLLKCLL